MGPLLLPCVVALGLFASSPLVPRPTAPSLRVRSRFTGQDLGLQDDVPPELPSAAVMTPTTADVVEPVVEDAAILEAPPTVELPTELPAPVVLPADATNPPATVDVQTLALPDGVKLPIEVPLVPSVAESSEPLPELPSIGELAVFCLPTLGIWLSSPLLSLIDTGVVGVTCATHHLAALAPSTKLCDYVAYFCTAMGAATTNLAADAFAHDKPGQAKRIIGGSLAISLVLGTAIAFTMFAAAGPLMAAMLGSASSSAPLLAAATEYTAIRALGYPAALMAMTLQSAFISTKDSRTPLMAVPFAAVVNLLGDMLLVAPLGAAGAAWATTAALYANAALLLGLWSRRLRKIEGENVLFVRPNRVEAKALLAFALPMMAALIARVYMGLSITLSAVALGTTALAANQVIESLYWLFCPFGEAISLCMQAYLPPILLRSRSLARRLQASATRAAWGLGTFAAVGAFAIPVAAPGIFTSAATVARSMGTAAPALAVALLTFVLSSAAEGMLIARKQLRVLAAAHVTNTIALSIALRMAVRWSGCGLRHVWALIGVLNLLRIGEFTLLLRRADTAAVLADRKMGGRWRRALKALRPRVDALRAERRESVHEAIPDVADIASHLLYSDEEGSPSSS